MTRILFFVLLLVLPAGRVLAADDDTKAKATGLFAEAQALADAGKLEAACAKFEESVKAHAGVGNRYHLADCWEKIGRFASAHALFNEVTAVTRELGQTERERAARSRAEALSTKFSRLRVEVPAPEEKLEVSSDDKLIAKDDWGKPLPIDPGRHELRAVAPGKKAWVTSIEVPNEPGTILVVVPELADEKPRASAPAPISSAEKEAVQKQAPPATEASGSGFRSASMLALLGIGAAGVVVGATMSAQYVGSHQDAQAVCRESVGCTPEQVALHEDLVNDARTARTWAFVGFGSGAAALAGAAFLHLTAPSGKERRRNAWVDADVSVSPRGAFGVLRGGF